MLIKIFELNIHFYMYKQHQKHLILKLRWACVSLARIDQSYFYNLQDFANKLVEFMIKNLLFLP